jgi:prevent-host-death family protein
MEISMCPHLFPGGVAMAEIIGIRELKNQASRILRTVREEQAEYVVTYQGHPIAVLRPFSNEDEAMLRQIAIEDELAAIDRLAEQITNAWISKKSATELLEEIREG